MALQYYHEMSFHCSEEISMTFLKMMSANHIQKHRNGGIPWKFSG